jgi:hypothetical protein
MNALAKWSGCAGKTELLLRPGHRTIILQPAGVKCIFGPNDGIHARPIQGYTPANDDSTIDLKRHLLYALAKLGVTMGVRVLL